MIINMFGGIVSFFQDIWTNFWGFFTEVLPNWFIQAFRLIFVIIYYIFIGLSHIIDFAEIVFKRVAGIDVLTLNGQEYGGSGSGQDLVYGFITNAEVMKVFWSVIALSVVLLFIFTIVAFIKSEFTLDLKGSAKGPIIGRAFKSALNLIAVPAISIIAIFGVNFLTKTLYSLFDTTGQTMAVKCYRLGTYGANRARTDEGFVEYISSGVWTSGANPFGGLSKEAMADAIDEAFVTGKQSGITFVKFGWTDKLKNEYKDWQTLILGYPSADSNFSHYNVLMVNYFYDLQQIQYILMLGSAIAIAWSMLGVCLAMIKRVFELTILFLLAPPMTAIAPLDGGAAEKKWRQEFTKRLVSVIATIFAYNMFFLLLPLIEQIKIFDTAVSTPMDSVNTMIYGLTPALTFWYNMFFEIICISVGLSIVKSASGLIANLLGIEDLIKSGGETMKKGVNVAKNAAFVAGALALPAIKGTMATARGIFGASSAAANRMSGSVEQAKSELGDAEAGKEEAQAEFDAADKALEDAKRRGASEGEKADLEEARDVALGKLRSASRSFRLRGMGVTEKEQQGFESEAQSAAAKARMDKEKELAKVDDMSTTEKNKAIEAAGKAAYEEKFSRIESRDSIRLRTLKPSDAFKSAIESELGKDSKTTSLVSQFGDKIENNALIKKLQDDPRFKYLPVVSNIPDMAKTLKSWLSVEDGSAMIRRLHDALTKQFGDGGGGDFYRLLWHKNARADLFESVPEAKMREAKIQNNQTMAARDAFTKEESEKKSRKEALREIMRMLARGKGMKDYEELYKKLSSGNLSDSEKTKIETKMAEIEVKGGYGSLKHQAEEFSKKAVSGSDELEALNKFKEEMQRDASAAAYRKELENVKRMERAAKDNGEEPQTKLTEQTSEKLAKDIADALHESKGVKFSKDQTIKVDMSVLTSSIESLETTMKGIADAIKEMNGGKGDNDKK